MDGASGMSAANYATWAISGLIGLLTAFGLSAAFSQFFNRRPSSEMVRAMPAVVVSLGIFGTFLGIFLGLRNFDTAQIAQSIPQLLEGLKTAFITSLAGMGAGLVLRLCYAQLDSRRPKENVDDPVELLRTIAERMQGAESTVKEVGDTLIKCFRADDDYSLVSQLKLIRTDMNDLKREVTKSLDEFGAKVAELGTEALVKSLREVIDQFNARLSDLVGAEFKQLRDAMLKLVDWQQQHRESVDAMQRQLGEHLTTVRHVTELMEKVAASVKAASEHLDSIDGSVSQLAVSSKDIDAHIEALKKQNEALAHFVAEVAKMGEQAGTVLPNLTRHLNEATSSLVDAGASVKTTASEAIVQMKDAVTAVGTSLDEVVKKHDGHTVKAIQDLESGLERTLNKSLESLGGQLAALSAKFAQDYTPLTDRLREVVRIGERLKDVPQA